MSPNVINIVRKIIRESVNKLFEDYVSRQRLHALFQNPSEYYDVYKGRPIDAMTDSPRDSIWVTTNVDSAKKHGHLQKYFMPKSLNILNTNYSVEWIERVAQFRMSGNPEEYKNKLGEAFIQFLKSMGYDGFQNKDNILVFNKNVLIKNRISESLKLIKKDYSKLFEDYVSGDSVTVNGVSLDLNDNDAYPFFYYNGKFYFGFDSESHWDMLDNDDDLVQEVEKLAKSYANYSDDDDGYEPYDDAREEIMQNAQYNGRIWTDSKVITFWKYPDKNTLVNIVDDINSQLNAANQIDGSWNMAIAKGDRHNGYFIPLKDYTLNKIPEKVQKQHLEKWKQHLLSPIAKSQVGVDDTPEGIGSKHKNYKYNRELDRILGRAQE